MEAYTKKGNPLGNPQGTDPHAKRIAKPPSRVQTTSRANEVVLKGTSFPLYDNSRQRIGKLKLHALYEIISMANASYPQTRVFPAPQRPATTATIATGNNSEW